MFTTDLTDKYGKKLITEINITSCSPPWDTITGSEFSFFANGPLIAIAPTGSAVFGVEWTGEDVLKVQNGNNPPIVNNQFSSTTSPVGPYINFAVASYNPESIDISIKNNGIFLAGSYTNEIQLNTPGQFGPYLYIEDNGYLSVETKGIAVSGGGLGSEFQAVKTINFAADSLTNPYIKAILGPNNDLSLSLENISGGGSSEITIENPDGTSITGKKISLATTVFTEGPYLQASSQSDGSGGQNVQLSLIGGFSGFITSKLANPTSTEILAAGIKSNLILNSVMPNYVGTETLPGPYIEFTQQSASVKATIENAMCFQSISGGAYLAGNLIKLGTSFIQGPEIKINSSNKTLEINVNNPLGQYIANNQSSFILDMVKNDQYYDLTGFRSSIGGTKYLDLNFNGETDLPTKLMSTNHVIIRVTGSTPPTIVWGNSSDYSFEWLDGSPPIIESGFLYMISFQYYPGSYSPRRVYAAVSYKTPQF